VINFFLIYSLLSLTVLVGVLLVTLGLMRNSEGTDGKADADSERDSSMEAEQMLDLGSTGSSQYHEQTGSGTVRGRSSGSVGRGMASLVNLFPARFRSMVRNAWLRLRRALGWGSKERETTPSGQLSLTDPNRCSTPLGGIVKWPCGPLQSFTTFSDQRKSKVKVEY
jgi:hypothetical protein